MGLSSLPTPSDGVFTLLLVKIAISFSLLKQIIRSFLHALGLNHHYLFDSNLYDPFELSSTVARDSISYQFKAQFKAIQFGRCANDRLGMVHHPDCRVCLSRFEPESLVNRLPCGHYFHAACLEKWLDYHHVTCPLCRTRVLPRGFDNDRVTFCPLS